MATLHFKDKELKCHCGCGHQRMMIDFLDKLESLRTLYGKPILLSSAYRCPEYNNKVSKSGFNGVHTMGIAVDILVYGKHAYELLNIALYLQFTGIGINQKGNKKLRYVHLDTLCSNNRPYIWSYI